MNDQDLERRIRKQMEKKFEERQDLIIHAAAFVLGNLLVWGIYMFAGGPAEVDFPFPLIVTGGWGVGIFAHAMVYYNKYGGGAVRREAAIQREITRYKDELGLYEKPKREHLRLNDDGEIVDEDALVEIPNRRERR
jgi:2TM domain